MTNTLSNKKGEYRPSRNQQQWDCLCEMLRINDRDKQPKEELIAIGGENRLRKKLPSEIVWEECGINPAIRPPDVVREVLIMQIGPQQGGQKFADSYNASQTRDPAECEASSLRISVHTLRSRIGKGASLLQRLKAFPFQQLPSSRVSQHMPVFHNHLTPR